MGAYDALLLSGILQAKRVIAIAPHYLIDRQHVAGETGNPANRPLQAQAR